MQGRTWTFLTIAVAVFLTVAGGGIAAGAVDGGNAASSDAALAAQADCSFPVSATDTTGTEVTVEEAPERIVVLQPSDAQIVWEMDAQDRVVGMDQGPATDYLNDTEGITNVKNDDGTVDVEQVTNLSADLILAANVTQSDTVEQLRNIDQTVYHFGEVRSIEEIYGNVNRTGELLGNCEEASDRVTGMQERLDRIEQAVGDEARPSVLYLFFGFTTGDNTHVHDMIEAAGAENVGAETDQSSYFEISEETVAANDPEWIVYPSDAQPPSGAPYDDTTALQEDQVLMVDTNYANQAGPRVVEVVETMAQEFHPDAFDENGDPIVETATPTPEATETPMATATMTPTEEAGETPTAENGPGFTPVTVLIAIAVAAIALVARRKGV